MLSNANSSKYLSETPYVDSSPELLRLCEKIRRQSSSKRDAAIAVFYIVREIKWGASPIYRASEALKRRKEPQICVSKAALQVALCRKLGIPARFHYWRVRFSDEVVRRINDLLFRESRRKFRNAELHHVAAEVYLGSWIVADATIDKGLEPVFTSNEWDGERDAYIKGFDFLEDCGVYADVPKAVIEICGGRGLPFYLRPFSPLIMRAVNRWINDLLDRIRSLNETPLQALPEGE